MKFKKTDVISNTYKIPEIRFEDSADTSLTSFGGLVIFQKLFQQLGLKRRLQDCFGHLRTSATYSAQVVVLCVVLHLLIGYRKLRDRDFYEGDPLVLRTLGLQRLPDVSTISRTLAGMDARAVEAYRALNRELVLDRLEAEQLARVTCDFDGSVLSTSRHAQGTAIGYNKKKKGARSYYPQFCTVAQTAQLLDLHHRPGNVHDSNGAREFIRQCMAEVRERLPKAALETRLDSAFFDESLLVQLALDKVDFTISVPFQRFPGLKKIIEDRRRWNRIDDDWSYFECDWKPESWMFQYRFLVVRQKKAKPTKGPLQLDLFEPRSHEYDYQVIVTRKTGQAAGVIDFHHGRGSQEGLFAEAKGHCQLEYIPVRSLHGNQIYCISAMLAHNLARELQMQTRDREYRTTPKRRNLWGFITLKTLREKLVRRAGRLIRPQGRLTLVLSGNQRVQEDIEAYLGYEHN